MRPISGWSKWAHKFRKDFILQGIDKSGYKYLKKSLTDDRNAVKIEEWHSFDALSKSLDDKKNKKIKKIK